MDVIQGRCGFAAVCAAVVPGAQDVGSKSVACVLFANEQNAINARFHLGQPAGSILGRLVARLLLCCYTLNTGKGRPKPQPHFQTMITFNDVKELATEGFFTMAFPHIFVNGSCDPTISDLLISKEWLESKRPKKACSRN